MSNWKFVDDSMSLLCVERGYEDGIKVADLARRHMYAKPLLVEHHLLDAQDATQYVRT